MRKRLFYLLAGFISCTLILAFSFTPFSSNTSLAYSLWLEHPVDSDFQGAEHIYAADVDGDGDMDILGAASVEDTIAWYENDGSGVFTYHVIDGTLDGANCVYAANVNGAGGIDVIASAGVADDIVWYANDGSGNFTGPNSIDASLDGANYVYAANIDGSGGIDVIASGTNTIAWYANNGSWTKTPIDTLSGANCVYAANIDESHGIDVIASGTNTIAWYANNGSWTKTTIASLTGANYVYARDVDGDTYVDVLGSAGDADDIAWFENDGSGTFTTHLIDQEFDGANSVHAADVDGDGDIDILGTAYNAGYVGWYENNGIENFTKHAIDDTFAGAKHVYTADIVVVVGDEYTNIVACAFSPTSGQIAWFSYPLGPTEGCFIATAAYGTPMAEEIDVLRDFRDQYLVTNPVGKALVDLYYKTSPPVAEFIDGHPALKPVVRAGLKPVIAVSAVAVNTTLAQKIAILSSMVLLSALLVVWLRRRAGRARGT